MAEGYDLTLTPTGVLTDSGNELWQCAGQIAGRVYLEEASIANRGTGLWRAVPYMAEALGGDRDLATMALADAIDAAFDAAVRQVTELGAVRVSPRVS